MSDPKYFSTDDMHQLATAALRAENRRLTRQQSESEIELLKFRIENARLKLLILKRDHDDADASHVAWFAGVKARVGIPEGATFGYERDTGLIIIDSPEQGI